LAAFITLLSVPGALWVASRVYFGRSTALFVLALSPAYLFFPKLYSSIGMGVGSIMWIGLVPSAFGVTLVLLSLAVLERWRRTRKDAWILAWILLVAGLGMGHTVSLMIGTGLFLIWAVSNRQEGRWLVRPALGYVWGVFASLWWLGPFAANLNLTSSEVRYGSGGISYLAMMYPVTYMYLGPVVAVFLLLVLIGLYFLVRRRAWSWLLFFLATVTPLIIRVQLVKLLPNFTFHYERFVVFAYVFGLVAAAVTVDEIWGKWADDVGRRKFYVAVLLAVIGGSYLMAFDFKPEIKTEGESLTLPEEWTWSEFEAADEGQFMLEALDRAPGVQRVLGLMPRAWTTTFLGAQHYFLSRVPLHNRQAMFGGVYVESSPLVPFVNPTIEALENWDTERHGDKRLRYVGPFREQGWSVQLDRLKTLGGSHVLAVKGFATDRLENSGAAVSLRETDNLQLFRLDGPAPLATSVQGVGCYFDLNGRTRFRDVALAVWAGEESYDVPVIHGGRVWPGEPWFERTGCRTVVLDASELTGEEPARWRGEGRSVIVLNGSGGDVDIEEFETVPLSRREITVDWPNGWPELQAAIADAVFEESQATVAFGGDGQVMEVEGDGPVFVRFGFSPYWESKDSDVYQTTTGFMLVTGDGTRTLDFRPSKGNRWFLVASYLAGAAWILFAVALVLRSRRKLERKRDTGQDKANE
jgi:hypothetical protein